MRKSSKTLGPLFAIVALSACAQPDALDTSGAVYDGIAADASITVTGTEPFWGLEIGPERDGAHAARFSHPGDIDGSEFTLTRFAGNNGLGFAGVLDVRPVHVAITPGACSDGMSDREYPFNATVALGEAKLLGCAYTSELSFTGPSAP